MTEKIRKSDNNEALYQMLEDLVGEAFDSDNEFERVLEQDFNQLFENEDFSKIDQLH